MEFGTDRCWVKFFVLSSLMLQLFSSAQAQTSSSTSLLNGYSDTVTVNFSQVTIGPPLINPTVNSGSIVVDQNHTLELTCEQAITQISPVFEKAPCRIVNGNLVLFSATSDTNTTVYYASIDFVPAAISISGTVDWFGSANNSYETLSIFVNNNLLLRVNNPAPGATFPISHTQTAGGNTYSLDGVFTYYPDVCPPPGAPHQLHSPA